MSLQERTMRKQLSANFWTDGTSVYCGRERLDGAVDLASFRPLGLRWSRDDRAVWWGSFRLTKADAGTFQSLNALYGKDFRNAWSGGQVVTGADTSSFEVLDPGLTHRGGPAPLNLQKEGYARDAHHVYFHEWTTGKPVALKGADPSSFVSLGNGYGRDRLRVYMGKVRIPKADPSSWVLLWPPYSRDDKAVFYLNKLVKGADPATFEVLEVGRDCNWWGRDANGYYRCGVAADRDGFEADIKKGIAHLTELYACVESGQFDDWRRDSQLSDSDVQGRGRKRAKTEAYEIGVDGRLVDIGFPIGALQMNGESTLVFDSGRVYAAGYVSGGSEVSLVSFDAETWRLKSTHNLPRGALLSAVRSDLAYVRQSDIIAGNNHVYAICTKTGAIRWKRRFVGYTTTVPRLADDLLLVGSNQHVFALNALTGKTKWQYTGKPCPDELHVVAGGQTVLFAENWFTTTALDVASGAIKWQRRVVDEFNGIYKTAVIGDRFFMASQGRITVQDIETGKIQTDISLDLDPYVAFSAEVVFWLRNESEENAVLSATRLSDGKVLWQRSQRLVRKASGALEEPRVPWNVHAGRLYTVSVMWGSQNRFVAIDAASGDDLWSISLKDPASESFGPMPLALHDDRLYIRVDTQLLIVNAGSQCVCP